MDIKETAEMEPEPIEVEAEIVETETPVISRLQTTETGY